MISIFLIVFALLALAMVGLCIRILIRHDRFGAHDVGADAYMRSKGIHCTTSQDREARRPRSGRIDPKQLCLAGMVGLLMLTSTGCSLQYQIKKADRKYDIGEYYDAAERYRKVYSKINPKTQRNLKATVAYRQAECYRILNNTSRAASGYKNAIRYGYATTDSLVFIQQARVLQYQGKYKDAEKSYLLYLDGHPGDYVATAGIYACRQIDEWKKTPTRYQFQPTKEMNGKRSSNGSPMFIGNNEDAVMFVSNRELQTTSKKKKKQVSPITGAPLFHLWSIRRDASGKWVDLAPAEGLGDSSGDSEQKSDSARNASQDIEMGACCFSSDGRTMYLTYACPVPNEDRGAQIYISNRASGEWSAPQPLKLFADSSITCAHPTLCATGDTLYFVSDAPGGMGGKDIWYAEQEGSGWSAPTNAGSRINTAGDEMFPYMHANGTLYFASNGHPGYGGLDIFAFDRDSNLVNMGHPFNSQGDDFGITFAGNTQNGFFSSNRGQKRGYDQIYSFLLPEMVFEIQGRILDPEGNPVNDSQLRLIGNDGTNTRLSVKKDGSYRIRIKKDVRYAMLAGARGYLNAANRLSTEGESDSHTYTLDFTLAPVSRPVKMDNIFYQFGSHLLTADSEAGLQQLTKMLTDNPNITIELSAHTDMKGDSIYNQKLSLRRAQSVVDYLLKQGIEPERITPVGYGETKPVIVSDEQHRQYPFLPVEQELNEAFILSLNEEQQEICNTLNRRTEFRVLKTTYKLY